MILECFGSISSLREMRGFCAQSSPRGNWVDNSQRNLIQSEAEALAKNPYVLTFILANNKMNFKENERLFVENSSFLPVKQEP